MTNPIAVSQRAREFAADGYMGSRYDPEFSKSLIRTGNADEHTLVQAFARFEAEIRADAVSQAMAIIEKMGSHFDRNSLKSEALREARSALFNYHSAIRNQKDHDHE